jgi:Spy/CpxP family protein refolding chaperone
MRVVSAVFALAVSLIMVGNLLAADEKPTREGNRPHRPAMERGDLFGGEMLKGLNLTDDQKAKVDDLKKEYGPKLKEAWEKTDAILTADQKKAREEAVEAARASGKRGPEVMKAAQEAMKLSDEQKTKLDAARKDTQALRKAAYEKLMSLLTPEQKETLKKNRPHRERPDQGK